MTVPPSQWLAVALRSDWIGHRCPASLAGSEDKLRRVTKVLEIDGERRLNLARGLGRTVTGFRHM